MKTGDREIKFPLKLRIIIEEIDQSAIVKTNSLKYYHETNFPLVCVSDLLLP